MTAAAMPVSELAMYFRRRAADLGAPLDHPTLQLLCFYAQAFHLAKADGPLFADAVRASAAGPEIAALRNDYECFGDGPIPPPGDGEREPMPATPFLASIAALDAVREDSRNGAGGEVPFDPVGLTLSERGAGAPIPSALMRKMVRLRFPHLAAMQWEAPSRTEVLRRARRAAQLRDAELQRERSADASRRPFSAPVHSRVRGTSRN